jgi:hypothetical protein
VCVLCTWAAGIATALALNACNALSGIDNFTITTGAETGTDGPDQGAGDGGVVKGDAPAQGGDATGTGDVAAGDTGMASVDAKADAASDAEGGTGSCDGGLVAHSNGIGQMFYDCAPLNTWNQTQAFGACTAFTGDAGACLVDPGFSCMGDVVCSKGYSVCACWVFNGTRPGRICNAGTAACCCPGASSPPAWN